MFFKTVVQINFVLCYGYAQYYRPLYFYYNGLCVSLVKDAKNYRLFLCLAFKTSLNLFMITAHIMPTKTASQRNNGSVRENQLCHTCRMVRCGNLQ